MSFNLIDIMDVFQQVMASHMFDAKPLPKTVLTYC